MFTSHANRREQAVRQPRATSACGRPVRRCERHRSDYELTFTQFTVGEASRPIDTDAGPAGVLICNEAFYGGMAAARVRAGATWLASLANDTWVSDAQFSRMALDMVRFRAIEERRRVVRASTWGPSALVDPFGRVTVATATGAQDTVEGNVESLGGETLYARVGDAFALACVAAVALGLMRREKAPRLTTRA
jgi:apolipoprotein N-acyltransferase